SYLAALGSEVEVLEASDALLKGMADPEAVQVVARKLKKNGVKIHLKAFAQTYKKSGKELEVTAKIDGKEQKIKADKILLTVGRKPNSDQMNLKGIGLAVDEKGFVKVNPQRKTNLPGIFAIGD